MSTITRTPPTPTQPTVGPPVMAKFSVSEVAINVLRFGLAWTFLWPFLDKTFGLGYSTTGVGRAWIDGGSPTKGFLSHLSVGPLKSAFGNIAGNGFIDVLFMATLLGVGVALALGVVLRFAALSGSILLFLMWVAEWPMARFGAPITKDNPTGLTKTTNPFLDDHLMYIVALVIVAAAATVPLWGLGKWWRAQTVVITHPFMR